LEDCGWFWLMDSVLTLENGTHMILYVSCGLGGGILGFARAFILAGVPSSVLTVWEAPATFCTEFMKMLYEQLASGHCLAHAMQKVVICMMCEPKKVRKGGRKGKGKVGEGEDVELKWTIFDWACLSCFGLPGVKFSDKVKCIGCSGGQV
jgi:hypothetical protein